MIIRLRASVNCLLAVTVLTTTAQPCHAQETAARVNAACVSCFIFHVSSEAAATLSLGPGALAGLTIVTNYAPGRSAAALERLRSSGAIAGLWLTPVDPVPPLDVLEAAAVIVLAGPVEGEGAVFAVKTLAAAARGARADVRILLDGPIPDALRGYVDSSIDRETTLQSEGRRRLVTLDPVDWNALAGFAAQRPLSTEVVAPALLDADEIVARHQAQRARQERLIRQTIARGSTTLLFNVPGFVAPVTITANTVVYRRPGLTEMEQFEIRVNGSAVAGGDATSPPRLPLIDAERIATPPLVITLGDAYRYTLEGRERIDESDVYVIGFEPRGENGDLARGRAWIDARTFALRRLETIQDRLRGAVVSSEQHDRFGSFRVNEDLVSLPVQTNVFQMYEGAGHRTPIHRTILTPEYEINPADFDGRLEAAHSSPHLMLRETPQGLRYLLRSKPGGDRATRSVAPRAGERIRAAVMGVLVDPNINVPLPFAGFSYVDLNLFNTGAQLNAFIGGTYGQLSWSLPSIAGSKWQAHGRAFAIAARYNDRAFQDGAEIYRENITQRPAHFSAGVIRPAYRTTRVRFDYELDYTNFDRASTTAPEFVVPADAVVHGFVSALESEKGPWSLRAWWNPAIRQHWRPWGTSDDPAASSRTFHRYGTLVARTLALNRSVASRVEAAWMGGHDLDRFSRYSFDAFDNRLRGYPTASLRYDHGAVVRTVTTWTARGWRVDAFGDAAYVRDPGLGASSRFFPGVGAAVEVAGPFRTLWSVEWGYGFRARNESGGYGTQAVRVTGFRVF